MHVYKMYMCVRKKYVKNNASFRFYLRYFWWGPKNLFPLKVFKINIMIIAASSMNKPQYYSNNTGYS